MLRLYQAEALVALQQDQAGIATPVGLARSGVRAKALVPPGLVHLRRNQIHTGLALVRGAVALTTSQSHPHAHADAGLALVSAGELEAGRALLDAAFDEYQAAGDDAGGRRLLPSRLCFAASIADDELIAKTRRALIALP